MEYANTARNQGKKRFVDMLKTLGNGEIKKGVDVLDNICKRLNHAREKHTAQDWKDFSLSNAHTALSNEVTEVGEEVFLKKDENRVLDEVLDVIAVGVRMLNKEYGGKDE